MIFGRKPKPPLAHAVELIDAAMEIPYMYLRDKRHLPSEDEIGRMDRLAESLFGYYATAQYIARKMRERLNGGSDDA